jgi:acetate kinase
MPQAIMALNAGSSSIKFSAAADTILQDEKSKPWDSRSDLTMTLLQRVEPLLGNDELVAVGHRIVHSGPDFSAPLLVDTCVLQALDGLTPLAPLHQPGCLAPIRSLLSARPNLQLVACFDTAFHRNLAPIYRRFPLPAAFESKGIRRYGFHGLSFEYVTQRLDRPDTRIVVAHLGSGCSICAIRDGKSVNTTMSLTPLDGAMMATRSGAIDPGLVLYLLRSEKMSAHDIEDLLYQKSGLLGVSGISSDMRTLIASKDPIARGAIDQFCARAAEQIAAMATSIDGVDMLVFTGGIGENSPEIRRNICDRLKWMGLRFDDNANTRKQDVISMQESLVEIRILATDEELMIAEHTLELMKCRH